MENKMKATKVVKGKVTKTYDDFRTLLKAVSEVQHKSFKLGFYDLPNEYFHVVNIYCREEIKPLQYIYEVYYLSANETTTYTMFFMRKNDKHFPVYLNKEGKYKLCKDGMYLFKRS